MLVIASILDLALRHHIILCGVQQPECGKSKSALEWSCMQLVNNKDARRLSQRRLTAARDNNEQPDGRLL